jgi:hypothetical protein
MAIKRGPDGIPVDTPSTTYNPDRPTVDSQAGARAPVDDDPTHKPPAAGGGSLFLDDAPTLPPRKQSGAGTLPTTPSEPTVPTDDPQTIIAGARRGPEAAASDPMADPVAGWLVVVKGPGQGNFLKLGYGQNSIGRGAGERVSLDFGDNQISRSGHAIVTYDPRGRRFYLQPGTGTNLTYLDDYSTPVLQPVPLAPFSHIYVGDTALRFVPLCGEQFSWDDVEADRC